jgi:hypothetical protein
VYKRQVYECRGDVCVANFLFLDVNLIVRVYQKDYLRVETEVTNPTKESDLTVLPMLKFSGGREGLKLICDLPLACIEKEEAFRACVSSVMQGLFHVDDKLARKLFDNVISITRELGGKGFTGNEIFKILVERYKIPRDLAETIIESYYALLEED